MPADTHKNKPGRNEPCPCRSGLKYKYCCISTELRRRIVEIDPNCSPHGRAVAIDLTHDLYNQMASGEIPLKNFCKDEGFYYFPFVTVAEHLELLNELAAGSLTRERILKLYRARISEESVLRLVDEASTWSVDFAKRRAIISDAVCAHFAGTYTLSVPAFFIQIEGLLRDVGSLPTTTKFKSTIPGNIWNSRLMFGLTDNAEYFNAFINRLFEGQQDADAFGRNSILHGSNTKYDNENQSLILILTVLEIRQFLWLKNNTFPILRGAVQ